MFQNRYLHLMEATNFVIRGVHLDVTDTLRRSAINRTSRLFRHNQHIERIYIDLELDQTRGAAERFVAKGHLEVGGISLIATARSENAYKAIDELVDALDELLSSRPQSNPPLSTQSNPPLSGALNTGQMRA